MEHAIIAGATAIAAAIVVGLAAIGAGIGDGLVTSKAVVIAFILLYANPLAK